MSALVRCSVTWIALSLLVACADEPENRPGAAGPPGTSATVRHAFDVTPGTASTPMPSDFEPLFGARAYFGVLGSAAYRIEIPPDWNGELVLWAHGARFGELEVVDPPLALREAMISQGYAWAASSFSENGYIPGIGANDTLRLKRQFADLFGPPRRTYIAGSSMGGNIVTLSLENFQEEYDGGLSFCGTVAGQEWIDYQLAWAMAAEFIAEHEFPLDQGPAAVAEVLESAVLPALGPPDAPSLRGEVFASVIRNLTGGARPFFAEGFLRAFEGNFGIILGDPGRILPMTRAATNETIHYRADPGLGFDGDAINKGVRRLPADPAVRDPRTHPDTAPTTGRISDPLVTLHETGDLVVPISMEQSYRRTVESAGRGHLLVQRVIRSARHCEFSGQEVTLAWNDLVRWVETGTKPAGDDISGDLSDLGLAFTDPLRPGDPGGRE